MGLPKGAVDETPRDERTSSAADAAGRIPVAHFYERVPDELRQLPNAEAVEAYRARASMPKRGIEGLTREHLLSHPVKGTWSIQQIVVHLMDADLIASYRMKRIIAEERPRLDCYDETAFSRLLFCDRLDAAAACEVFRLNRELTATMLHALPDAAFERAARHPEIGELSLGRLVRLYCFHVDHHMKFLTEKRALLGA
jgi:hypothetical protein